MSPYNMQLNLKNFWTIITDDINWYSKKNDACSIASCEKKIVFSVIYALVSFNWIQVCRSLKSSTKNIFASALTNLKWVTMLQ